MYKVNTPARTHSYFVLRFEFYFSGVDTLAFLPRLRGGFVGSIDASARIAATVSSEEDTKLLAPLALMTVGDCATVTTVFFLVGGVTFICTVRKSFAGG